MSSYSRLIPPLAVAVAAVALAGCGGSDQKAASADTATTSATTSAAPAASAASASALAVASPADGSLVYDPKQLSAPAGAVRIAYANPSAVPHNIAVEDQSGKAVGSEVKPFVKGEQTLKASLKAGTYTYYCSVPGHRQAGMVGTLTVK